MNKVILIGNIGKDPETKHLDNGHQVTKLTLATRKSIKQEDGTYKDGADWHFLEFWDNQSKVIDQYCKKGHKIAIEGENKTRSWDEEGTGKKTFQSFVRCFKVELLERKPSDGSSDRPPEQETPDDDLPF
jgi:single-strand DNA-binding protein